MINLTRYIIFGIILLFLSTEITAQNSGKTSGGSLMTDNWKNITQADKLFREKNYREAVQIYERIAKKEPVSEVKLRIGQCYYFLNQAEKSVKWYEQVIDTAQITELKHRLYYAQSLSRLQQYDKAKIYFKKYSQTSDSYIINVNSDTGFYYQREEFYVLKKMASLNSEESDFAPAYYQNKVVFVSSRDDFTPVKHINRSSGNHIFKLYSAEITDERNTLGQFATDNTQKFHKNIRSQFNQGPVAFYANDSKMIFTQNNADGRKSRRGKKGLLHLGLYFAEKNADGNWENITPFQHNSSDYSLAHPAISKDGKTLYFASDMPNGKGASDIYVSHFQGDSTWTKPENLGLPINTAGKEVFPFLFEKEGRKPKLYFSSDGHGGLGGLEIMYAKLLDDGWTPPENMGFPVNTNHDDFGLVADSTGRKVLFTSNRTGGQGDDDIYAVEILQEPESSRFLEVAGTITEENLLGGAPKKLKNVAIRIINKYDNTVSSETLTDSLGRFSFQVSLQTPYLVEATKEGFHKREYKVKPHKEKAVSKDAPYRMRLNKIFVNLMMQNKNPLLELDPFENIPEEKITDSISDVYVSRDTSGIISDYKSNFMGKVKVGSTGDLLYGIPIYVYNSEGKLINTVITDKSGNYRLNLDEGKQYILKTEWKKDGVDYSRDCMKLDARQLPKNELVISERDFFIMPLSLNSMRSFRINYAVKEWEVNEQVASQLDEVVVFMKSNLSVRAEVSAHTDSRGDAGFNQMLSLARAQDAVKYLMLKGIDGTRLEARGYGEKILLNQCDDDTKCSNEQHEINRRIEITIIGINPTENQEFDPVNCDHCPQNIIKQNKP